MKKGIFCEYMKSICFIIKKYIVLLCLLILLILTSCTNLIPASNDYSVPVDTLQPDTNHNGHEAEHQKIIAPKLFDGYLLNPGIGWQHDPDVVSSNYLPETVAYGNRLELTWNEFNPSEGYYDWSPIDEQLLSSVADGKQFSFRVMTMIGEIYGEHALPDWVIEKGAIIFSNGDPDYANCVYQEQWGIFVSTLIDRYDGNSSIAFIDISGYGDFNEWSWVDQTEWDILWDQMYENGNANPSTIETLDGQARRRLADMFIGGSMENHQCRDRDNNIQTTNYSYRGFQKTQLVMPYAGIIQSLQYVYSRRNDIGFRHDCLGRENDILEQGQLIRVWQNAPVIYEFCSPLDFDLTIAQRDLQASHGSLVHNNGYDQDFQDLRQLMIGVGYRFFLKEAWFVDQVQVGKELPVSMIWQNLGSSPSYPKMGQKYDLHLYLLDKQNAEIAAEVEVPAKISTWMPAIAPGSEPPDYQVDAIIRLSNTIEPGVYFLKVAIIDTRTGLPINLAIDEPNPDGYYFLSEIEVISFENR